MKKHWIIWTLWAIAIVVLIVIWLTRPENFARYEGRDAWQWALDVQSPHGTARDAANAALKHMGADAVPLLIRKLDSRESFFRQTRLWLAPKLPKKMGDSLTRGLEFRSLPDEHRVAAVAVAVIGPPARDAVPALARLVRNGNLAEAWPAAGALGAIGEPAVPALIELTRHPNPLARQAALFSLGQVGPRAATAVPAIIANFGDTNEPVRSFAIQALAQIGEPATQPVLRTVEQTHGLTRQTAAKAIVAMYPRPRLVAPALIAMAADSDPTSRRVALESLTALSVSYTNAVQLYITALADTDADVRLAATKAVGVAAFRSQAAIPALKSLQRDDPEAAVRAAAREALEKIAAASAPKSTAP